ncbi:sulfatase-like hydrolase/transferase [Nocardioides gansuensis]|uniref:sulfatase-like hydrolase/transferase n=1 Tax=Nocardioides gansuensis TaxID=2138300 RepID=UPI001403E60E|nr:sulfatase-like hydrolase/transferase [Nocardioides gansuensis]
MSRVRRGVAAACLLLLTACTAAEGTPSGRAQVQRAQAQPVQGGDAVAVSAVKPRSAPRAADRPNMVLVLMDDFSMDLVQTMRTARVLRRKGAWWDRAFSVDSLCCVSRSSLLTGQYPHQTGVRTNTSGDRDAAPLGGFPAFHEHGNEARSFAVALQRAGYTTGFVGKYLNEYEWLAGRALPPVQPGWSVFNVVFGSAYDGWDFDSTYLEGGQLKVRHHPAPAASASAEEKDNASAASVIERLSLDFIRAQAGAAAPYFLEVAVYAPHNRTQPKGYYDGDPVFPPLFRDRAGADGPGNCGRVPCRSLTTGDLPGFGDDPRDNRPVTRRGEPARAWNTVPGSLPSSAAIHDLRDRARMAQSIDRTVRRILRVVDDNTYVVLTSDNGFHLGQLGLGRGKGTAYGTDSRVPLYVVGPGVSPGRRAEVTTNIDLAPTFEEIAGLAPAPYRSGVSLLPTFADRSLVRQRYAFLEHTGQALVKGDPDAAFTGDELDRVPSYVAVRSRDALLVRYDLDPAADREQWAYEFYRYTRRLSWERTNTFARKAHRPKVRELLGKLEQWDACAGAAGDQPVGPACRGLTS